MEYVPKAKVISTVGLLLAFGTYSLKLYGRLNVIIRSNRLQSTGWLGVSR